MIYRARALSEIFAEQANRHYARAIAAYLAGNSALADERMAKGDRAFSRSSQALEIETSGALVIAGYGESYDAR